MRNGPQIRIYSPKTRKATPKVFFVSMDLRTTISEQTQNQLGVLEEAFAQNELYRTGEQDDYIAKARWPEFGTITVTSAHWSNPGEAYTRSHGTEGGTLECSPPPNLESLPHPTTKGQVPEET